MNSNQSSPNAISHRELKIFLNKAKKEILCSSTSKNEETNKNKEFNDLIRVWKNTSQKILLELNEKDKALEKEKSSKSFIALGAMGAHINMALQALKASEFDL